MADGVIEINVSGLAAWLQLERVVRRIGLLSLLFALGAIARAGLLVGGTITLLLIGSATFGLRWIRHQIIDTYRRPHGPAQTIARPISKPGPFRGKNRGPVYTIAAARVAFPLVLFAGMIFVGGTLSAALPRKPI
jgi:hypothetical protein